MQGTNEHLHLPIDEILTLATTVQHISEHRETAMTIANLPSAVSDLLDDDVLTLLRRANREDLNNVALDDVRAAMAQTISDYGRTITDGAAFLAAIVLNLDGQVIGSVMRDASSLPQRLSMLALD